MYTFLNQKYGLKNITIIKKTLKMIKDRHGKDIDIDNEDRKSRRSDSSNSLDCIVECEKPK
jgi:hypothetical protein